MRVFKYIKASRFFPEYAPDVVRYRHKICGNDGRSECNFTPDDLILINKGLCRLFESLCSVDTDKKMELNENGSSIWIDGESYDSNIIEDYLGVKGYVETKRFPKGDVLITFDSNKNAKLSLCESFNRIKNDGNSCTISKSGSVLKFKKSIAKLV